MTRERLFGALLSLWLMFALLIVVMSTFLSPRGFALPIPGRSASETLIGVLFYAPPLVGAFLWLEDSVGSKKTQRATAATRLGWALAIFLGLLVALLVIPVAKTLFIG